jgi:MFS family permease
MSNAPSEIEHELVDYDNNEQWAEPGAGQHSLPQADGGREAWLFLICCFLCEAFVWGMPFSYGVFQVYYNTHAPFSSSPSGVAAIGTTQTGIMYLSTPLLALLMQRWPQLRRLGMFAGAAIIVLSVVIASFCNTVGGLLATQGVMYAIGGMTLYYPAMVYVDEWFIARKGMAYGVMWAGTGSAGVVVPFLLQWLLDSYGFRTALRVWAVILVRLPQHLDTRKPANMISRLSA